MSEEQPFATLKKDSPFYDIFPKGKVPLFYQAFGTSPAVLKDDPETDVYMLDTNKISAGQLEKVLNILMQKFNETREEIYNDIRTRAGKLPLRKSQVKYSNIDAVDMRMFI